MHSIRIPLILILAILIFAPFFHYDLIFPPSKFAEFAEASWLPHLCPRYKLRSHAGGSRLVWKPLTEDSIFFLQTSCSETLSSRQVVLKLENLEVTWLDLDEVFNEEPLLSWHQSRQWMLNDVRAPTFVSDSGRIELLRRYGGTYLDFDCIALKPMPNHTNWMGWHGPAQINNAAMSVTKGHPLLERFVSSIPKAFDPTSCCSIGPFLLFDAVHRLCPNVPDNISEEAVTCANLTIFERTRLYPFSPYNELDFIFLEKKNKALNFLDAHQEAQFLHLYSSHTKGVRVPLGNSTLLGEAAIRNCPRVYSAIEKHGLQL